MRESPRDFAQRPLPSMMIATWRGTVLVLEDITTPYHVESVAERQVARVANDEIRMTKLEGMTNELMANFFSLVFVLRAYFVIRHSCFVILWLKQEQIVDEFTI